MMPLIAQYRPDRVVAWRGAEAVTQSQFLAAAAALAQTLPSATAAVNLCEDRYCFMLAFAALCLRGQTNLLPSSTAVQVLADIIASQPGSYILSDRDLPDAPCPVIIVDGSLNAPPVSMVPELSADHIAAVAYTSGSTGQPQAHAKSWRTLVETARLAATRFSIGAAAPNIVATVPAQHMYGLETTVMMPLASGSAASCSRPFFPRDLADALSDIPAPRLLITTPVHLRACLSSGISLPPLQMIISATAPMSREQAVAIEQRFGADLREIYGCTEAGSMAVRHTRESDIWELHPGMRFVEAAGKVSVLAAHLPLAIELDDHVEILESNRFRLLGRGNDLLKVAGKRASLQALTRALLAIPGVADGVVFVPDADGQQEPRPAALVVAPDLTEAEILTRLSASVDPVLLPRPLLRVEQLPRDAVGKLPRAALLAMLERARA